MGQAVYDSHGIVDDSPPNTTPLDDKHCKVTPFDQVQLH